MCFVFFLFKQKTAYEMRISDWSSDVCSSDLGAYIGSFGDWRFGNRRFTIDDGGGSKTQDRSGSCKRAGNRPRHPVHGYSRRFAMPQAMPPLNKWLKTS